MGRTTFFIKNKGGPSRASKSNLLSEGGEMVAKVFIGAPVRNRAWVLPRHLEALLNQDGIEKEFCYVVNDCDDNTQEILEHYGINYVIHNLGKTYGHIRGQYSIRNLAILRNRLIKEFLQSDCDYLFSVDTDVIIPKGSLKRLIDNDKDIVSMVIRNHPSFMAHNIMVNGRHLPLIPEGLIPVDVTGAVYLIKRRVIEAGVRYDYHVQGEDVAFCEKAKKLGFEIYCDTRLKPIHAYAEGVDLIAHVVSTKK